MTIRTMTIDDYDQVWHLWSEIKGFGIRTLDDSREGVEKFLREIHLPAWWRKRTEW